MTLMGKTFHSFITLSRLDCDELISVIVCLGRPMTVQVISGQQVSNGTAGGGAIKQRVGQKQATGYIS